MAAVDEDLDRLTEREREVMRLIARGYAYKEVAKELFISIKTVETHMSSVLRKLQLSSRHELDPLGLRPPPALEAGSAPRFRRRGAGYTRGDAGCRPVRPCSSPGSEAPVAEVSTSTDADVDDGGLRRSITGRQLFFYTLGDVLGSGIYVLIGLVAAAVGGAFWIAFAVGVTRRRDHRYGVRRAGHEVPPGRRCRALRQQGVRQQGADVPDHRVLPVRQLRRGRVAGHRVLAVLRRALVGAAGPAGEPACSSLLLSVVNFIGITESVVINMVMAFVEIAGLLIVMFIAVWFIAEGNADFGVLTDFTTAGGVSPALAILAGVALSFFAMTGFENTANVAEETIDPHKAFPRSLIGGMLTAGVIYVLVSMAAALTVDTDEAGRLRRGAARGREGRHPPVRGRLAWSRCSRSSR